MKNLENFEKVLKRELGTFEKNLVDFQENMKNEFSDFKSEMKNEFSDFKSEMKNEMSDFKSEMKNEMSDFKSEMKEEMSNFKTEIRKEVSDEIRERFFCFEQDYGKTINVIHDVVIQTKEIASKNSGEIAILKLKTSDLQTKYLYHDDKIQKNENKINSKRKSKKVKKINSKV